MESQRNINKSMNKEDLELKEALPVVEELNALINELKNKKLKISSWYGTFDLTAKPDSFERINRGYGYTGLEGAVDDMNFPWFLYWEIVWVIINNDFNKDQKVLDMGGSSSLFSYFLASRGIDVTTIDIKRDLVDNANHVAQQMGWKLHNYIMDIRELDFDCKFDHITSICVYEHLPMYDRIAINKKIKDFLVEGGTLSLTFDYRNPSMFARISSPDDVYKQFVEPSGLEMRGNRDFIDNNKNYLLHPFYFRPVKWSYKLYSIANRRFSPVELFKTKDFNDYTFGAIFLHKTG